MKGISGRESVRNPLQSVDEYHPEDTLVSISRMLLWLLFFLMSNFLKIIYTEKVGKNNIPIQKGLLIMRDIPKNRISTRALTVWKTSAIISSMIGWAIAITVLVLTIIFDWTYWILTGLLILCMIESILTIFILPKLKWKRWRYEVHEHEIDLQRGVLIVKRTIIPMNRVQHVDTQQGPLLRKHHLATVTISTAATVHEIPALDLEEADQLRDSISRLARVDEDDV